MKKRWISLALAAALVMSLFLTGCGSSASAAKKPEAPAKSTEAALAASEAPAAEAVKAYFIGPMAGGAAWGQAEKGFLKACEEFGWEGQYLGPTSANANNEMINLIETAITNGANVLITPVMELDMWADPLIAPGKLVLPLLPSMQMTLTAAMRLSALTPLVLVLLLLRLCLRPWATRISMWPPCRLI